MNVLLIEINPFAPASPPISLGYIASFLKSKGFTVKILTLGEDTSVSRAGLHQLVSSFQPALVGLTAYQRTMLYVIGLARFIKSVNTNIKIAIGGPQATFMPSVAFAELPEIDYISRSSGEVTLLGIARAIENGTPFSDLSGVTYKNASGAVYETADLEGFADLDSYPSPYLDDVFDYSCMSEAIMLTSRGCPHHCIYCYTPHAFKHKVSFHSVDRVIEEIRWIRKKGVRRLWFADPNISFKPARLIGLLDRILTKGLETEMWLQTRADLVNPEVMKKMKRAGVSTIAFGLESASERVLTKLGKHISVQTVAKAISLAQSEDIEVELFTIFGLPYETFEDALKTLEFVKKNNVKIMGNTNSQQMQIYFGTHMARKYEKYNIRPLNTNRPVYLSIGCQYETDHMAYSDIQKIQALWRAHSRDRGRRIVS
ncbi:MAG: B12-binding domain-containing radical SAM protein, partial [Deltaproteobacteria bacterium]|nr:B12-binding domain-containing radical SAM protein [Deltaproteobacteria bacterium]MBW1793126.1 B12-binding domain-containing radical SAM protein [Deltaproteobacteria bacterium]